MVKWFAQDCFVHCMAAVDLWGVLASNHHMCYSWTASFGSPGHSLIGSHSNCNRRSAWWYNCQAEQGKLWVCFRVSWSTQCILWGHASHTLPWRRILHHSLYHWGCVGTRLSALLFTVAPWLISRFVSVCNACGLGDMYYFSDIRHATRHSFTVLCVGMRQF